MRCLQADGSFLISNKEGFLTRRSLTGRWWCEEYEVVNVLYAVKPDGDRKAPFPPCSIHGASRSASVSVLRAGVLVFGLLRFEGGSGVSNRCKMHVVYLMELRWVLE